MSLEANKYIISHKHKFIYCSVPKAGSSSVKDSILKLHLVENRGGVSTHKIFKEEDMLIKMGDFRIRRLKREYGDYFMFAVVRNPFSRLVSCYLNKILTLCEYTYMYNGEISSYASFPEFIEFISGKPEKLMDPHHKPQYRFICNKAGDIIPDFVGRLESFERDYGIIYKKIGIKKPPNMPHKAPGKRTEEVIEEKRSLLEKIHGRYIDISDYKSFYSDETREVVSEIYKKDIEIFNYKF